MGWAAAGAPIPGADSPRCCPVLLLHHFSDLLRHWTTPFFSDNKQSSVVLQPCFWCSIPHKETPPAPAGPACSRDSAGKSLHAELKPALHSSISPHDVTASNSQCPAPHRSRSQPSPRDAPPATAAGS